MNKVRKRFNELYRISKRVKASMKKGKEKQIRRIPGNEWLRTPPREKVVELETFNIDRELAAEWLTSVETFFFSVFGSENPTYTRFKAYCDAVPRSGHWLVFENCLPIFYSAKEQFEGGYVFEIKDLVHQEVFDDELDQAEYFLKGKWIIPALVIAGTVLEQKLRDLCNRHSIEIEKPTIQPMRVELTKAGVFASSVSTEILAWGQNRNDAAHGKQEKLKLLQPTDVQRMIDGIRDFIKTH